MQHPTNIVNRESGLTAPTAVGSGALLGRDWRGEPIKPDEKPSDKIMVWLIEPHPYNNSQYDGCIVRDYQKAMDTAWDAVEMVMDNADEDDLKDGSMVSVKIGLRKMTVEEYEAAQQGDD
jgi:hypothetical protein